jgi:hypothetical protein
MEKQSITGTRALGPVVMGLLTLDLTAPFPFGAVANAKSFKPHNGFARP